MRRFWEFDRAVVLIVAMIAGGSLAYKNKTALAETAHKIFQTTNDKISDLTFRMTGRQTNFGVGDIRRSERERRGGRSYGYHRGRERKVAVVDCYGHVWIVPASLQPQSCCY
jgi:hypothetical protein